MPKTEKIVEKQIDALVGALSDPVIVYDPGWDVPKQLKAEIQLARLAQLIRKEEGVATDVEAMAYLSNASLVAPMRSEWAEIYMYLFTKWMGDKTPEDLRKEEITDYEKGLLQEFKRWLWNTRVKARQERARAKRASEKAEAAARAISRPGRPRFTVSGRHPAELSDGAPVESDRIPKPRQQGGNSPTERRERGSCGPSAGAKAEAAVKSSNCHVRGRV